MARIAFNFYSLPLVLCLQDLSLNTLDQRLRRLCVPSKDTGRCRGSEALQKEWKDGNKDALRKLATETNLDPEARESGFCNGERSTRCPAQGFPKFCPLGIPRNSKKPSHPLR